MERLTGKWKVTITSGPLWLRAMNMVGDTKVIDGDKGHNVMLGVKWGRFKIVPGSVLIEAADFSLRYVDGTIVDLVTFKAPDTLYGQFYQKDVDADKSCNNPWKFVGNFEMARIK